MNKLTYSELRNDIHNSYSPKYHVPHYVPGYKGLYNRQLKVNKGLLLAVGVLTTTTLLTFIGCDMRTKGLRAEIEALQSQNKLSLNMVNSYVDYTQELETKLAQKQTLPTEPKDIIRYVFGKDANKMIKIAQCESTMRPNATNKNTNGSTDTGLFQINSVHNVPERYLKNPMINTLVAKQIYDAQGVSPWVCARKLAIR